MTERHTENKELTSASNNKGNLNKKQVDLGVAPYFTASVVANVFEGGVFFKSTAKMAGNHTPPDRKAQDIKGLSYNSRIRLIKFFSTVQLKKYWSIIFSTLTYHQDYSTDGYETKSDLDKYFKRILRIYPNVSYVWRMELQKRGAPHFHIMWLLPKEKDNIFKTIFMEDLYDSWMSIKSCQCEHCKRHAVDNKEILDARMAINYVAKYISKETENQERAFNGRRWGYARNIQRACLERIHISPLQFIYLKLLCLNLYREDQRRRDYILCNLKDITSYFLLCNTDDLRPLFVDAISKSDIECYKLCKSAGGLPFDFDFPSVDMKDNKQIKLSSYNKI